MSKHRGGSDPALQAPADGAAGAAGVGLNGGAATTPEKPPDMRKLTEAQQAQAQNHLLRKELMFARKRMLELEQETLKVRQENLGLRAQIHNQASATADKERDDFLTSLGADPKADKVDLNGEMVVIQRGALKKA